MADTLGCRRNNNSWSCTLKCVLVVVVMHTAFIQYWLLYLLGGQGDPGVQLVLSIALPGVNSTMEKRRIFVTVLAMTLSC